MAITVKDIQEKIFATQAADGYNVEQVDDFLDELAAQLGATTRENQALAAQVAELKEALAAAENAKAEAEKKVPDYNESGYFRNLESAMRESLIGAQRIADETVAEANKKAQQLIEDANAQAEKILADASSQADTAMGSASKNVIELNAETERLQASLKAYREGFRKLVEEQLKVLDESEKLIK